jgi:SSS family solute:Na+ symporter
VLYPKLESADAAFATIVKDELPMGVRGLVQAAAVVHHPTGPRSAR